MKCSLFQGEDVKQDSRLLEQKQRKYFYRPICSVFGHWQHYIFIKKCYVRTNVLEKKLVMFITLEMSWAGFRNAVSFCLLCFTRNED